MDRSPDDLDDKIRRLPGAEGSDRPSRLDETQRNALQTVVIALALTIAAVIVWQAFDVFLLLFAGILLAILLRAPAHWLAARTPLGQRSAYAIVVIVLVGAAIGLGFVLAPRIGDQVDELASRLPQAAQQLTSGLERYEWWRWLHERLLGEGGEASSGGLFSRATGVVSTTFTAVTNVVVILFVGLYLGANPAIYVRGFLRLLPLRRRQRGREVLEAVGVSLERWLVGMMASMTIIMIGTAITLLLMDIPLALTLALLAGLLTFIPNFGPILSAVPAVLLGMSQSPMKGVWVAVAYLAIQTVETYLVTPLIQRRAVHLPPAVILLAQVLLGVTAGFLGLVLAMPLAAALLVAVQCLYVEDVLGDRVKSVGEASKADGT